MEPTSSSDTSALSDFSPDESFCRRLDEADSLASFRNQFHIPVRPDGSEEVYLCGNSLGLMPRLAQAYLDQECDKWQKLAVRGHFETDHPWMPYHEFLTPQLARVVGARETEVVAMNSLTVNLHLLMVSFYRPTPTRHKILIEQHAFPSDRYAVVSQLSVHGFDPETSLIEVKPREGEETLRDEDILAAIDEHGASLALVLLPGVQYYTGQVFDMAGITRAAHGVGSIVGFDLAHAAGNIQLNLHDWDVDFAVWCHYKYLNSGPGAVAGAFVHERQATRPDLVRFAGWWGHDKESRFKMRPQFKPIPTAEGWQLSNPPILSLATIRASLELFDRAGGVETLCVKSHLLASYLDRLIDSQLGDAVRVLTPQEDSRRGCQVSFQIRSEVIAGREIFRQLETAGVTCDWREPNVIRIAPVPLYNKYSDIHRFVRTLRALLS